MSLVPVFVINLDRSKDRWERWLRFKDVIREPAVDGRTLDLETSPLISLRTKSKVLSREPRTEHYQINTRGAIGCYLSHINTLKKMVDLQLPLAIICEDDVDLSKMRDNSISQSVLAYVTEDMVRDYDVIVFNSSIMSKPGQPIMYAGNSCTLWTLRGAMIAVQNAFPIEGHVDHYYNALWNLGLLRIKLMPEGLLTTDFDMSMIEHDDLVCRSEFKASFSTFFVILFAFSVLVFIGAKTWKRRSHQ